MNTNFRLAVLFAVGGFVQLNGMWLFGYLSGVLIPVLVVTIVAGLLARSITLAGFSALLGLVLPVAGLMGLAVLFLLVKVPTENPQTKESWVLGNQARYRCAPSLPGEPIDASEQRAVEASLWLRKANSRLDVEGLMALRDDSNPIVNLFAGSALETRFDWLTRRISYLRSHLEAFPEDSRSWRLLAEALRYHVQLKDPALESGESKRVMQEANYLFQQLQLPGEMTFIPDLDLKNG